MNRLFFLLFLLFFKVRFVKFCKGQVNSQLASEQAFLEAVSLRSKWEREIDEQCEKLQQWRANNKKVNGGKDFGQRLTSLTNFKMKEHNQNFKFQNYRSFTVGL